MWKNADIPRSDVHPQLIEPSATELYYTMSPFDMWRIADVSRSDVILHLGNQIQYYRALLHHVSLTYTRVQVYQGQMYTPC